MSRRTSLEWTESKGSGEMNASIQDERPRQSRRRGPSGTMWQSKVGRGGCRDYLAPVARCSSEMFWQMGGEEAGGSAVNVQI